MAKLDDKMKNYLLSLKPEDISYEIITDLFANKTEKAEDGTFKLIKSKINPYDTFTLKKNEYINKSDIETTAGRFIYNKLVVERLIAAFGDYQNITLNKGNIKKVDDIMASALLNDKITPDDFIMYIDLHQWIGMTFISVLCPSFTPTIISPNPKVIALRDKLFKEHEKEIQDGDAITVAKIEQECIELAKKELEGDPGMLLYGSGARGSFGNNYKNISISRGSILNPTTGKWEIMKNNFMEGINKEDISASANSVITGAYPKAIGQRTFGYFTKQITSALQSAVLDKPGSDCGSTLTVDIEITKSNKKLFNYRWIKENGKLKLLDDKNIDSYVGKTVKMRTPLFCKNKQGICSVCAGKIYEKLGIENMGLTTAKVSSTMSNASMKKFHDAIVKTSTLTADTLTI